MKKTRNNFEDRIDASLRDREVSYEYESEKIPYLISGNYIPDFVLATKIGKVYLETKGHFRREDKAKLVAVKKLNPGIDLRLIFYSENAKNTRWAKKHNIPYAIATIPEEWFLEFGYISMTNKLHHPTNKLERIKTRLKKHEQKEQTKKVSRSSRVRRKLEEEHVQEKEHENELKEFTQ